ncbi:hypothetical protein [Halomonas sp. ALS9]|uniref:hypothetical protein n=2 Tax=Halomonas TaxID=2745 RepID=UPI001F0A4A2B|nr:hypothetical protein [Halomonas sp. ALS9]
MPSLDVRYDNVTMDIREGARPDGLIAAGHTLTSGFLWIFCLGLFLLLIVPIDGFGYVETLTLCLAGLYALFLFVFNPAVSFVNTQLKRATPVRFNRQRREVAFVVAPSDRFWLPAPDNLWFMGLGPIAMSIVSGPIAIFNISQWLVGAEETFPLGQVLFHAMAMAILFGYTSVYDHIAYLCKRERRTVLVPWEDLVAIVGVSWSVALKDVSNFGWSLTLLVPDPERPGYSMPGAGIILSADGELEALAQWEYFRCFMEEGPDAITPTARGWGLEWYDDYVAHEKAECKRTNNKARWRRFRRKRMWEHARLANWYTDYRTKHVLPKAIPKDWLAEWSTPLPPLEWARPSPALTELSAVLCAAYRRGETLITMGDIEKRFGVTVPSASQRAYPTFPFRRGGSR